MSEEQWKFPEELLLDETAPRVIIDDSKRENLIIHIEGLQAVLTKRNARILELETEKDELKAGSLSDPERRKEYQRGWRACASFLETETRQLGYKLGQVTSVAARAYNDGRSEQYEAGKG